MIEGLVNTVKSYLGYTAPKPPTQSSSSFPYRKTFGALVLMGLVGREGFYIADPYNPSNSWETATKISLVYGGTELFGTFGGIAAWALTSSALCAPPKVVRNCPEVYEGPWQDYPVVCQEATGTIPMMEGLPYVLSRFDQLVEASDILDYSLTGLPPEANITQETLLFDHQIWPDHNLTCLQQNSTLLVGFTGPNLYVWERTPGSKLTLLNSTNFGQDRPFLQGTINGQVVFLSTKETLEMISLDDPNAPHRYPPILREMEAIIVDPVREILWSTTSDGAETKLLGYSIANPNVPIQYAQFPLDGAEARPPLTLANPTLLLIPGSDDKLLRVDVSALALPHEMTPIFLNGTVTGVVMNEAGFAVIFTPTGISTWNVTGPTPQLISAESLNPDTHISSLVSSPPYFVGQYHDVKNAGIVVIKDNGTNRLRFAPTSPINNFVFAGGNTIILCGDGIASYTINGINVSLTPNEAGVVPFSFQAMNREGNATVPMRLDVQSAMTTSPPPPTTAPQTTAQLHQTTALQTTASQTTAQPHQTTKLQPTTSPSPVTPKNGVKWYNLFFLAIPISYIMGLIATVVGINILRAKKKVKDQGDGEKEKLINE